MYRIVTNSALDRYRVLKRRNEVGLDVLSGEWQKICSGKTGLVLDNKDLSRLIILQRLLTAACVCLMMILGTEQFLFIQKVNRSGNG